MDVRTADPGRLVWYLQGELEFGAAGAGRWRPCRCLHVNDKFRVGVREASELVLVQVHDEEFVGGRELHRLPGELFVEVGSVAFVLLSNGKHRVKEGSAGREAFAKGAGPRALRDGSAPWTAPRRIGAKPAAARGPGAWSFTSHHHHHYLGSSTVWY